MYNTIISQNITNKQIIFVNDGSTDETEQIIQLLNDNRVMYLYQHNQGVSTARNNGLKMATGQYVIFFDADDLMEPNFLLERVTELEKNKDLHFVCGLVQNFSDTGLINAFSRGTATQILEEVLLYDNNVTTCPSNYVFTTAFLIKNKLQFNPTLSSTADKYFLIQCAQFGKGKLIQGTSKLLYRVSPNSMSHALTPALVADNEVFYSLIKHNNLITNNLKQKSLFLQEYILAGANYKLGNIKKAVYFTQKAILKNSFLFLKKYLKKK